jgi:hypothetical protein
MGGETTLVSGGYLVARRTPRRPGLSEDRFPERMISASERVAPILPSVPLGWVEAANAPPGPFSSYADEVQGKILWALAADLERFGLESSRAAVLADCLAAATERGDFYSPSGFVSVEAARTLLRCVSADAVDGVILGLALPPTEVDAVVSREEPGSYLAALLHWGAAPDPTGVELGWEVLGSEDGELVSWVDNPIALLRAPAVQPNENGLLATREDANCIAAYLNLPDTRTADVHWASWRLSAFAVVADACAA